MITNGKSQQTNSILVIVFLLLSVFTATGVNADETSFTINSEKHRIQVAQVVSGLSSPWSIAFVSETDWLVTERSGALRRVIDGKLLEQPVSGLPAIKSKGQGGLLDVVLDPGFSENRLIYLSYVAGRLGAYGTEVARAELIDNKLQNLEVIFRALPKSRGGRHFGSRLAFDEQEYLYISLGDRGVRENGQRLNTHPGSVIRLNKDGTIPDNNPVSSIAGASPEIFSFGHRNIQGMSYDSLTGRLWSHEHGPQGGDELNVIEPGVNYGWPVITYGVNYGSGTKIGEGTRKSGMKQPATNWVPSIAPSGLAVYNDGPFKKWKGNLLVGALKFQLLVRLELSGTKVISEERLLEGKLGRIRDVRIGPDGLIYLLTDSKSGAVYRLSPAD